MYDVVILAGGLGTRLKTISGEIPKPMVDISGQPFLYRLMKYLEQQGVRRIILSLSYRADYIINRVKNDNPVNCEIDFVVEEKPLGTGGAIKLATSKVKTDKFIVLNGDTYCELDYDAFVKVSESSHLLISGVEIEDVSRYGSLQLDNENNVLAMIEKGLSGPGVINSGTYVLYKTSIQSFPQDEFSFETDFLPVFDGVFKAYTSKPYFIDIGIPEDYHKACERFK
ncbi:NTP transferase domain-containing protein [Vibrio cholerae]|nr:NTP transferase domain-containing protein [Vibrio cholerae]EJY0884458.1 nucleotidyltransferase family protein [Vibrio cholerae]BCN19544.1 D-glycero-alpha-D-manno-heptose 1-phosphate guanylyltransferase [Vibrio cholerae]GHW83615.1 nucleotidyl transferase [Vibrio cholerae]